RPELQILELLAERGVWSLSELVASARQGIGIVCLSVAKCSLSEE
ncbi:hypothetical protein A2U01_0101705, partial [Trifolium medium]|nr:hypothetical protein [Trifolium medium]